ncbi:MAG: sulfatase-like hydrolase/transferase, partial [bacterium]|nr:sulfatase-like hydrolase/transferase [bacterium]
MAKRPNIILADQLAASFVGCYGSGVNSTPTLDRLAAEGVRFDRAYAHVPVCAPNRATILTGRSQEIHGVVTNNLNLVHDGPTYADVLQREGYRTGSFGKFHLSPMMYPLPRNFNFLGFDESVPSEDPRLGPWIDWIEREHPEAYEQALATCWPMLYIDHYPTPGGGTRNLRPARQDRRAVGRANRHVGIGAVETHALGR